MFCGSSYLSKKPSSYVSFFTSRTPGDVDQTIMNDKRRDKTLAGRFSIAFESLDGAGARRGRCPRFTRHSREAGPGKSTASRAPKPLLVLRSVNVSDSSFE